MRFDEISQKFPADHLKAQKIGVTESVSSLWQFCVFFLFLKFGVMNFVLFYFVFFLSTCTRKGTNKFNGLANLGNSTGGNAINLSRKTLISFAAKHYVME